jgi:hypothetical protein
MGDYSSQINTLIDNQKYLMSGVNTVYPSFYLGDLINKETKIESDKINNFIINQDDIKLKTRLNLAKLYSDENEVLSINDKLIKNNKDIYNSDFNENIEKIDQLNNIISTKNKAIQINQYDQLKKDRIIFIIKKIILFFVLMIIPQILIVMGYLSIINGIIFIIICAIITVIVVFFQMKNNQDNEAVNIINKTKQTAKDFTRTVIRNVVPKSFIKSCPSKKNPDKIIQYDYNTGNEVWLDNSENQWIDGDVPSIGGTKQGYLNLGEKAEPMPYYEGDSSTPQYTCKWTDDPAKMTNMNRGTQFTTTIPCEYYPGYKTIQKS